MPKKAPPRPAPAPAPTPTPTRRRASPEERLEMLRVRVERAERRASIPRPSPEERIAQARSRLEHAERRAAARAALSDPERGPMIRRVRGALATMEALGVHTGGELRAHLELLTHGGGQ